MKFSRRIYLKNYFKKEIDFNLSKINYIELPKRLSSLEQTGLRFENLTIVAPVIKLLS